ncbi:MAG TPA: nucleotidyltransferase domain-containing protein [Thermoanaerobaculia bacterium]
MISAIETLETQLGVKWNAIRAARAKSEELVTSLGGALSDLHDATFSVIVTGSVGRGEANEGSDADWLLLVDGPSDPEHAILARTTGTRVLDIVAKDVGRTGTFGGIVASHELVHYIAGTRDSNENLTRRILLLSESRALTNPFVRERVIRNVLARYVVHDRSVQSRSGRRQSVPHFLLNDVVRYWRTMASDYASKMWERQREGWGVRNVKLRFSRKLLFIWGLLAAFSGELFAPPELHAVENDDDYFLMRAELIRTQTDVPPLELLARVVLEAADDDVADAIFTSYDQFLSTLADPAAREQLEAVPFEGALAEPAYAGLREASQRFRKGVNRLFFDVHPKLPTLIREFGVF